MDGWMGRFYRLVTNVYYIILFKFIVQESIGETKESSGLPRTLQEDESEA